MMEMFKYYYYYLHNQDVTRTPKDFDPTNERTCGSNLGGQYSLESKTAKAPSAYLYFRGPFLTLYNVFFHTLNRHIHKHTHTFTHTHE